MRKHKAQYSHLVLEKRCGKEQQVEPGFSLTLGTELTSCSVRGNFLRNSRVNQKIYEYSRETLNKHCQKSLEHMPCASFSLHNILEQKRSVVGKSGEVTS